MYRALVHPWYLGRYEDEPGSEQCPGKVDEGVSHTPKLLTKPDLKQTVQ